MGASCAEDLIIVRILLDKNRSFQIGVGMRDEDRVEMLLLLVQNVDVFAWSPYEVPKVDPEFIVHKLNVDPLFSSRSRSRGGQLRNTLKQLSKKLRG